MMSAVGDDASYGHNQYQQLASKGEDDLEENRVSGTTSTKKQKSKLDELRALEAQPLRLVARYFSESLLFDLIFGVLLIFYTDVLLDLQMMQNFYNHEDYLFLTMNAGAIVLCLLFTGILIFQRTYLGEVANTPAWFVRLVVFLLPLNLHVLCLAAWSMYTGQKHEFLVSAKMFESVIEATISSCVQSYAILYEASDDVSSKLKGYQLWVAYSSIFMSYVSLTVAYAKFDAMETTALGFRGQVKGWFRRVDSPGSFWHGLDVPSRLVLIAVARMCETTSRILSLAFFFFLARHPRCWYTGLWKEPEIALITFDLVMNFCLILYVQGRRGLWWNAVIWTLPNFVCFVNPLLEQESLVSARAVHYYSLRTVELVLMASYLLRRTSMESLWKDVCKDSSQHLFLALAISTPTWMVLVPYIRSMSDVGMIAWFDNAPERFSQEIFTSEEELFRDALLDGSKGWFDKAKQDKFRSECYSLLRDAVSKLATDLPAIPITGKAEGEILEYKAKGEIVEDEEVESGSEDALRTDHETVCCCIPMRYFRNWLREEIKREEKKASEILGTSFTSLIGMSANLAPYLQHKFIDGTSSEHEDVWEISKLYVDILELTTKALANVDILQNTLNFNFDSHHYNQLMLMIPAKELVNNYEPQMFQAKLAFVKQFIHAGFEKMGEAFAPRVKQILVRLNIQLPEYMKPRNAAPIEVSTTQIMPLMSSVTQAPMGEHAFIEQARVLLDIYVNAKEKCRQRQKFADIFRPNSEVDEHNAEFPWDDVENEMNRVLAAYESEFGDNSRVNSGTAPDRSSVADRSKVDDGRRRARSPQAPENESRAVPRALLAIVAGALIHVEEQSVKCSFEIRTREQREALLNTLVNTGMCLDTRNVSGALRDLEGFPCGPMLKLEACTENFLLAGLNEEETAEVTNALSTLQQEKQEEQIAEVVTRKQEPASFVQALSPGDTMVLKSTLKIPGCSENSTVGERGTILSIDERTEEVRIWFAGKGLPLTVSGKDSGDANFSKLRKVSLMMNDWARVKKSGAIGNIVATFSTGRYLVKIYPSEGGGESLRVRTESDQSSSPSYELCETAEELEAIWVVRDGLPIDEGVDCLTINRFDRQAQTTSVEEIRNLCMADSNCVGFAYCPEAPKDPSGPAPAWWPKKNFTGFDPSTATYTQKHKSKNETWQWHYISHRAQEAAQEAADKAFESRLDSITRRFCEIQMDHAATDAFAAEVIPELRATMRQSKTLGAVFMRSGLLNDVLLGYKANLMPVEATDHKAAEIAGALRLLITEAEAKAKDASKERPATEGAGDTQAEEATEDKGAEVDEEDWGTPQSEWKAEDEEAEGPETAGKVHVEGPEEVQAQTDQQNEEATLAGKIVKFRRAAELCSVQFSSKGEQSYGVVDFVRLKCIDRKASPIEYFLNEGRNTSGLRKGNIWRVIDTELFLVEYIVAIDTELFKMCDARRSAEASPKFYALLDKLRKHISKDWILELSHIADDLKQWIVSAVGTESKAFSTKIKRLEDRKCEIEEMEKEVASTEEKLNNHKAQQAQEKSKPNQRNQMFNLGSVSEDKSPAVIEEELKEKLAAMKDAINHLSATFDSELDDVEEEHKAQLRKAEDVVEREFYAFVLDELKKKFPKMPDVEKAADKHLNALAKMTKDLAEQMEKTFRSIDKENQKRRDERQKEVENQKQRQLEQRERVIATLQRQLDEATQREQERNNKERNNKNCCYPRFRR